MHMHKLIQIAHRAQTRTRTVTVAPVPTEHVFIVRIARIVRIVRMGTPVPAYAIVGAIRKHKRTHKDTS